MGSVALEDMKIESITEFIIKTVRIGKRDCAASMVVMKYFNVVNALCAQNIDDIMKKMGGRIFADIE